MDIQKNQFLSIDRLADQYLSKTQKSAGSSKEVTPSFQEILQNKALQRNISYGDAEKLKFSKHALARLEDRNIQLSAEQLDRLNDGAGRAGAKGIKDSLVIVDELAFIVNIPNKTVVTAMDSTETNENVFTNINGAVIM